VENPGENQGIFLDVGGEKIGFREPCVKLADFPTGFAQVTAS
jgi:hypothetical protein